MGEVIDRGEMVTLQQVYQRKLQQDIEERARIEHEVIAPYAARAWVPKKDVYSQIFRRAQQLHAARANWDDERPPSRPVIACKTCYDAGFVSVNGRATSCPSCGVEVQRRRSQERIMGRWPVHARLDLIALAKAQFDTDYISGFSDSDIPPADKERIKRRLQFALDAARRFATVWPAGIILSFDGPYGAGKTQLEAKIYAVAVRSGKGAIYITGMDLEKAMTQFKGEGAEEARADTLRDLIEVDVLLIDEADHITNKGGEGWVERHLFDIVDTRQREGRSTVLAGNALGQLPGAVVSRMRGAGSLLVDLSGVPDARAIFAKGDASWQALPAPKGG